jgi:hypothetical protein
MKALQPVIFGLMLAVAIAIPLLAEHRAHVRWRTEQQTAQQQVVLLEQTLAANQQLTNLVARAKNAPALSGAQLTELLKLRSEVGQLHQTLQQMDQLRREIQRLNERLQDMAKDEAMGRDDYTALLKDEMPRRQLRAAQLKRWLEETPQEKIPELKFLSEGDWIEMVDDPLVTDDDYRDAASRLRNRAEADFAEMALTALKQYAQANNGQFPTDLSELKPYLGSSIDDAILQRFEIVPAKSLVSFLSHLGGDWLITQKAPINKELDGRMVIGLTGYRGTYNVNRWDPVQ